VAVGIVGTFDVANFGDLLFPEIAAHELGRRLGPLHLERYSYRAMSAPPWVYPVKPLEDLAGDLAGLDLLVVGGGHLVRFDKAVAPGYEPTSSELHHPTGYWLTPTLLAAAAGVPTAWNALGASPDTPAWAAPLLAGAMEGLDYVAVRDGPSLAELQRVAPGVPVRLVPDPAFGIAALLETVAERSAALRLQHRLDRPYVIVQPSTRLRDAGPVIRAAADAAREAGRDVVELPISPALGDGAGVIDLGPGTTRIEPWPDPISIGLLVAGAEAVVAHSLHLSIVALVHGVPVLRLAAPKGSKYEQLDRFTGVEVIDPRGSGLAGRLVSATRGSPAPDVLERASQLTRHWDTIASLVTSDDPAARERRRTSLGRLVMHLPSVLEDLAEAGSAADVEVAKLRDVSAAMERELDEAHKRTAVAEAAAVEHADRLAEVHQQIAQLQFAAGEAERRAAAARNLLQEELAVRDARLIEANSNIARLTRELTRVTKELERLTRRRFIRVVLRVAAIVRRLRLLLGGGSGGSPAGARQGEAADGQSRKREATVAEEKAFVERLRSQLPPSDRRRGPPVSIIVPTRDGRRHLERLLPALESTTYRDFELVVVDNGSTDGTREYLAAVPRTFELRVIANDDNRSFSEACNQGLEAAAGTLVLLLNNDIEPIAPGWLGRMVTTLEQSKATAVGARLIYPRRPGLDNAGDRTYPDLTLQHRGIGFRPDDGVPAARNLGAGEDPLTELAAGTREAAGLTAACLLVDREAIRAVGGLTAGYVYGTEDVDLCLKLRASGGKLVYDGGAALWHHEFGTQNVEGSDWKRNNRRANRQLFVDRWGPQLFRQVMLDRLENRGRWSEQPVHVGITLTRDDPTAGWGDYYTARELGQAFEAIGWRVSYLERHAERWYEPDPSIDVIVSLLDALDLRRLPRQVVTVAWIRNWTHRWLSQPWFDDYDLVFASSEGSLRLVEELSSHRGRLLPLATNPERFAPAPPDPALAADVMFAGNYWGQPRGILESLGGLDGGLTIKVFGKGWSGTPLGVHDQGALPYERLPAAYSSARVVIDDTAGPTKPYGAVNARVFDALAAGAVVVTDNEGATELFGDDFPVARSAGELAGLVDGLLADPARAAAIAERFRAMVLERHTYAHRVQQIREALIEWVGADRVSILVGAPDREKSLSWGDYHFAHSLQRQLHEAGLPTRVEVLPDWERASTARQDVVIHLFGLREYRPRPSQLNLLWIISHPDLVRTAACERYDHVFVASDSFADSLAKAVSVPVTPLHQATDSARFRPDPVGPRHDLLFVANSRKTRRKIVDDIGHTSLDLAIYGRDWTDDLVDRSYVKGEYIPNEILRRYYSSARIVLNDHWDDMRVGGFIANRLYDALACGAFVISDRVDGMDIEFQGAVETYETPDELHALIARYIDDEAARRDLGERGRSVVLAQHTFAHRTTTLLSTIGQLRRQRPRDVSDQPAIERWLGRHGRRGPARSVMPEAEAAPPAEQVATASH
jgi:GT2 family glycosyltransferase/spore maturation protein CgeB